MDHLCNSDRSVDAWNVVRLHDALYAGLHSQPFIILQPVLYVSPNIIAPVKTSTEPLNRGDVLETIPGVMAGPTSRRTQDQVLQLHNGRTQTIYSIGI